MIPFTVVYHTKDCRYCDGINCGIVVPQYPEGVCNVFLQRPNRNVKQRFGTFSNNILISNL